MIKYRILHRAFQHMYIAASHVLMRKVYFFIEVIVGLLMKRVLRVIGYIFLGAAILVVAANQFIRVTGGPHKEGQGIMGVRLILRAELLVK